MTKKSEPSFEAFCKCFAGVFKKHAYTERRSVYTCYIRDAIRDYVEATEERRTDLMESSAREDTVGHYIAKALLRQGWTPDQILCYATLQQDLVNEAEQYSGLVFYDALCAASYSHAGFYREGNGARYAWILAGSPDITDYLEPDQGPEPDDD